MGEKEDNKTESSEEREIKEGNISLVLDSYNDIFSDFDPRPYSERAISDDFLEECRRAVRDKKEGAKFELRLLIRKLERNFKDEEKIKKRLKTHFQKHFLEKEKEMASLRKEGILWFIIGVILIFFSTIVYQKKGLLYTFLLIILEPAGWFTIWNSLDKFFFETKKKKVEIDFYKKISKLEILFFSY